MDYGLYPLSLHHRQMFCGDIHLQVRSILAEEKSEWSEVTNEKMCIQSHEGTVINDDKMSNSKHGQQQFLV